jgi:hypothetical protein
MIALASSAVAGWFTNWIAALIGYAAFILYAFVRSPTWSNDPFVLLPLNVDHEMPPAVRIEQGIAAAAIPPIVAYIAYRFVLS